MDIDYKEILKVAKNLSEEIAKLQSTEEINEKVHSFLMETTHSDFVDFFIFNPKEQSLYNRFDKTSISMIQPDGCLGSTFLTKEANTCNYIISHKDYNQQFDNPKLHKLRSQLLFPLLSKGDLVAIIRLSRATQNRFRLYTVDDLEILKLLDPYLLSVAQNQNNQALVNSETQNELAEKLDVRIKQSENINTQKKGENINLLPEIAGFIHDIKTPASTLYGFLDLLENCIEDKRLKEFVSNAKESATFINTLVSELVLKTKDNYEMMSDNVKVINTVNFFAEITNQFSAKMLQKQINYFIITAPNSPKQIKIDKYKITRIITNLIGNAYKFTPKHKSITFSVRFNKEKNRLRISVKDTGIGIAPEHQKKVFESFKQATDDTSSEYGGTGLGLAVSAQLVKELGGELKLNSEEDKGSEFYFDMPVEVVDNMEAFEPFFNLNKKIVIAAGSVKHQQAEVMSEYLQKLGMPASNIFIKDTLLNNTTHLICFEHMMSQEILIKAKRANIKVLLVEEQLFSLYDKKVFESYPIASLNTFYADKLHEFIYSSKRLKVMVLDDSEINTKLFSAYFSLEQMDVHTYTDALKGLGRLIKDKDFDVIFLDKYMPNLDGTDLLRQFRQREKVEKLKPIYAVSITGDVERSEEEKMLYDDFLPKPFNKEKIFAIIHKLNKLHFHTH